MLPDLSILIALLLGLYALGPGEASDRVDPLQAIGGTAAVVMVVVALSRMASERAIRAVVARDAAELVRAGRSTGTVPLLGWLVILYAFGWGDFVGTTVPRVWFLVPHVLLFLPYALMVGAGWSAVRRVEAAFAPPDAPPPGAWRRGLARNGLVLIPLAVLTALSEAFFVLAELRVEPVRRAHLVYQAFPDLEVSVVLLLAMAIGWFAPALIRRVLRAVPLPPGAARSWIEQQLRALGVGARDIPLWETKGRVMNALVVGLTARTRYVVVTDALLSRLTLPEMLAVVSHEAGHARLRHLPWFLLVGLSSILWLRSAEEWLLPLLGPGSAVLLPAAQLAFIWFVLLGVLSRRFERQADVFGAQYAAAQLPASDPVLVPQSPEPVPLGTAAMIQALDRVAAEGGARHSHRHGSIDERTAFLAAFATDRGTREAFARDVRRTRLALVGFAVLAVASTALRVPGGLDRGEVALGIGEADALERDARDLASAGRVAEAREAERRARGRYAEVARVLERRPDDRLLKAYVAFSTYGAASLDLRRLDAPTEARRGLERVLALVAAPDTPLLQTLAFHGRLDLALLALRDPTGAGADLDAARLLREAEALPIEGRRRAVKEARLRALRNGLRLRSEDPDVAAQARRDLEFEASGAPDDAPEWQELARDIRSLLR